MTTNEDPRLPLEQVLDVAGTRLRLRTAGLGRPSPVIVLEAGGGATCDWWAWLQADLSTRFGTLSYDRAGLGGSGPAHGGSDATACSPRLHALLRRVLEPGTPLVLVGHSLGGLYALYHACTRRDRVTGLVLVDPTDPQPAGVFGWMQQQVLVSALAGTGLAARAGLLRRFGPFKRLVAGLPERERERALGFLSSPHHLQGFRREIASLEATRSALSRLSVPDRLPILIVSAGHGSPARREQVIQRNRLLARRLGNARHAVIGDATHGSLLTDAMHARSLGRHLSGFIERIPDSTRA